MAKIEIEWLTSSSEDCETCGPSYAEGAWVSIDGASALNLEPHASCFGGASYDREDVYRRILAHLGHEVVDL
ncbi:hypothetical protein [Shinella zoogloeoides]|uniref:hypothetical protein n=1 Tax=Shinella zoogloeoides TaxID=352475 RepID=UPI001F5AC6EB|nr:hypothetical protein [Shinella zoogloeoides]